MAVPSSSVNMERLKDRNVELCRLCVVMAFIVSVKYILGRALLDVYLFLVFYFLCKLIV